jgi:hypothetical protein
MTVNPTRALDPFTVYVSRGGLTHHHIDLTVAAVGIDHPLAPIEHGWFGAVPSSHLGGVGLDLMEAIPSPHD